ncbi:hypothetical protein AAF712_009725 [Marasmius tenuissimus]|uniref:F-box domain-containing protein n=1 Tax=Marasmius tenuissimus TaxID=585030 RepID=A0ABR2ZPC0_9AGAR
MTSTHPRTRRTNLPCCNKALPSSTYPFPTPPTPPKTPSKRHKTFNRQTKDGEGCSSCGLYDLPLELLSMTFQSLPLEDLLAISKVSKPLHRVLTSPLMRSLWRDELGRHDCPRTPPLMEPFDFVVFLFRGESKCQLCGGWRGVNVKPALAIGRQLCRRCFQDRFATQASITKTLAVGVSQTILDLVPSTEGDDGRIWYSVDYLVEAMGYLRIGGSIEVLKVQHVDVVQLMSECQQWFSRQERIKTAQAIRKRRECIEAKLLQAGYNEHDFEAVSNHALVNVGGRLRDKDWAAFVFPQLAPSIAESRSARMSQNLQYDNTIFERVRLFRPLLRALPACLPVQLRRCFPDSQTTCLLPICRDLLIQPSTVSVTDKDFKSLEGDILTEARSWLQVQRGELRKLYINGIPTLQNISQPFSSTVKWPVGEECLELAVAQFTCHATADNLDHLNALFRCLACQRHNNPYVGNWRGCLLHSTHHLESPKFERVERNFKADSDRPWHGGISRGAYAARRKGKEVDNLYSREVPKLLERNQKDMKKERRPQRERMKEPQELRRSTRAAIKRLTVERFSFLKDLGPVTELSTTQLTMTLAQLAAVRHESEVEETRNQDPDLSSVENALDVELQEREGMAPGKRKQSPEGFTERPINKKQAYRVHPTPPVVQWNFIARGPIKGLQKERRAFGAIPGDVHGAERRKARDRARKRADTNAKLGKEVFAPKSGFGSAFQDTNVSSTGWQGVNSSVDVRVAIRKALRDGIKFNLRLIPYVG